MRVKMTTDNEVNVEEKPRHPDRTRDLFGVQLEVSTQHVVPDSTARWQWPAACPLDGSSLQANPHYQVH